jgi:DNA-binding transcriptional LysR family regulator
VRVNRADPIAFMSNTPLIRLVGDDPMCQTIDALAAQLNVRSEPQVQVQTSRLALELVRLGLGWTVIDFLSAAKLDPTTMVAVELHSLPLVPLYAYHAQAFPPGRHAMGLLDMLPGQLGAALSHQRASPY